MPATAAASLTLTRSAGMGVMCDDVYTAIQWASRNGEQYGFEGQRFAVIGDSAGGTLATVASMRARDEDGPTIRLQVRFIRYSITTTRRAHTDSLDPLGAS